MQNRDTNFTIGVDCERGRGCSLALVRYALIILLAQRLAHMSVVKLRTIRVPHRCHEAHLGWRVRKVVRKFKLGLEKSTLAAGEEDVRAWVASVTGLAHACFCMSSSSSHVQGSARRPDKENLPEKEVVILWSYRDTLGRALCELCIGSASGVKRSWQVLSVCCRH